MARPKSVMLPSDPMLLQAMLDGLDMQKQRVEAQIASVRSALGGGRKAAAPAPAVSSAAAPAVAAAPRSKRILSAAARARIAAAQKKRWAAFRKDKKAGDAE
jgi:hypothetical protein